MELHGLYRGQDGRLTHLPDAYVAQVLCRSHALHEVPRVEVVLFAAELDILLLREAQLSLLNCSPSSSPFKLFPICK